MKYCLEDSVLIDRNCGGVKLFGSRYLGLSDGNILDNRPAGLTVRIQDKRVNMTNHDWKESGCRMTQLVTVTRNELERMAAYGLNIRSKAGKARTYCRSNLRFDESNAFK